MKRFYLVIPVLGLLFILANSATASAFVCLERSIVALIIPFFFRALTESECLAGIHNSSGDWVRESRWRVDGLEITESLADEVIAELSLKEINVPIIGTVEILCSGIFDGTISTEGNGQITELLSLSGTAISLVGLSGTPLECVNISKCPSPLVWAVGLPWATQGAVSVETPEEFEEVIENAKFETRCAGVIGEPSDTCTVEALPGSLENMAEGDLLESISIENVGTCELAGEKAVTILSDEPALIQVLEGLELAASS